MSSWLGALSAGGATIGGLLVAVTGYRAFKKRSRVDADTVDLAALEKSVAAMSTTLDWQIKERTYMESRLVAADAVANSMHIRVTALESELNTERRAREADTRMCDEKLVALAGIINRLGGSTEGIV